MAKKINLFESLKQTKIEREVEDFYNSALAVYFPNNIITHPYACDGLLEATIDDKLFKLIIEYKYNEDFKSKTARAKVILQAIFYIKQFEINGQIIPNVCLIGDKNECFVFHTNDIIKYLDEDVNWKVAPSGAAVKYPELVLKLANDADINPFVFEINKDFDFELVANKIKDLALNVKRFIHITEHNISIVFDYFKSRVITNASKISANDIVAIFNGVITKSDNYFLHPNKNNILVSPFGNIQINGDAYNSFIGFFNREYSPKEKMRFAEISDRLIEDTNRRNKGEFYTPTLFVDYAHKMISETLGADWKNEYVVWDNCCGTKNLTRDYRFKELYCSTLEKAELDISEKYNPEAESFVFDFLNDPIVGRDSLMGVYDDKLPNGLKDALLENKPIVFLLNPPYATPSKLLGTINKENVQVDTLVRKNMDNMKEARANLYCQFLWRIKMIKEKFNLTNCYIAIYSPTLFLTGQGYSIFRKEFFKQFKFLNGIQFNAGHFSNVIASWGISFSIWECGETIDKNNFNYTLVDNIGDEIKIINKKIIYNCDNVKTASKWVREETNKLKTYVYPNLSSAINIKYVDGCRIGKCVNNFIGFFFIGGNNVETNNQHCSIFSSAASLGVGLSIIEKNYNKCITLFAARKLIDSNWINSKDEYLAPNESQPKFQEFVNDSIVYSLFNGASNQSSLRNINYHNKLWDIKNEFFWMSKQEIEDLANTYKNDDCYADVHTASERFVYQKLQEIELSPEAQAVLDKANEIVKKTFPYRNLYNDSHPEVQINNWDCGFYQIKMLCKEYMPDLLKEFKEIYKALADKMRPMVYTLGFLK